MRELGIWNQLDPQRLGAVDCMQVFGDGDGRLDFLAADGGYNELAWIIEADLVLSELWQSLTRQHNVTVFAPAKPVALETGDKDVNLTLEDGRSLIGALLVGADGRDSWVRQAAGIEAQIRPYHQQTIATVFRTTMPHGRIARQWLMADGSVMAWLPMPHNRVSLAWSLPDERAAEFMALSEEAFSQRVAAAGEHALGDMAEEGPRAAFDLHFMRLKSVVAPRLALIGDAAHAIHPLTGHGVNLGFQDARALARLVGVEACPDIGEDFLLRRYKRARAEEPFVMQYATDGLYHLFASQNPLLVRLRNFGMNITGSVPGVHRLLARYATGRSALY